MARAIVDAQYCAQGEVRSMLKSSAWARRGAAGPLKLVLALPACVPRRPLKCRYCARLTPCSRPAPHP